MKGSAGPPISARLSQVLVAYTIEVDCLFDLQMSEAGFDEYGLSLVAWSNLMQYVGDDGVTGQEVMDRTHTTQSQMAQIAGTLDRWFLIEVESGKFRGEDRPGWLTSKGITSKSIFRPRPQGQAAIEVWPKVIAQVERRWAKRYPAELALLRPAMAEVISQTKTAMPDGVPSGWIRGDWRQFPEANLKQAAEAPLHVLLSRTLLALTMAFERNSPHPLALVANTLRVLGDAGIPLSAVAALSGLPSQMSSVQVTAAKNAGLVRVVPDPASKIGKKLVSLTDDGTAAQADYLNRSAEAERALGPRATVLRDTFDAMLDGRLVKALTPPSGVSRAGTPHPPLGMSSNIRRGGNPNAEAYMGPGHIAREKELVAQTETFLSDPGTRLPHYPVWDQNRGFGP